MFLTIIPESDWSECVEFPTSCKAVTVHLNVFNFNVFIIIIIVLSIVSTYVGMCIVDVPHNLKVII